jgi:hypothetical protein
MEKMRNQTHLCVATKSGRALILLVGCLLSGGAGRVLEAQAVSVSVWPSEMDHSLESVVVFQSQSYEKTEAKIQVYEDALAQQIAQINVAAASPAAASKPDEAPPSMDQEADILIVNPLKNGAEAIGSGPGSEIDFVLTAQLFRTVKPKAYLIASGVTGSNDLESLAFRNPDGTYVLFTVNHSKSPVSLEAFWKDGVFTYTQAGSSIGIFAWDPKSQLVSLVPTGSRIPVKGSVSIEAKCSKLTPLGIDLRCDSGASNCSIFPMHFTCNSQPGSVMLSVTAYSTNANGADGTKPGFVTITAAPDVGEPTSLRVPCCGAGR